MASAAYPVLEPKDLAGAMVLCCAVLASKLPEAQPGRNGKFSDNEVIGFLKTCFGEGQEIIPTTDVDNTRSSSKKSKATTSSTGTFDNSSVNEARIR